MDLSTIAFPISPSPDSAPFWDAVQRREFVLPRCVPCDRAFWYPRNLCPACGSRDVEWRPATPRATVHTFCVHFHSSLPHLAGAVPFVTALVDLADGPRMMGLLDVAPDPATISCGIDVAVTFTSTADERIVPVFTRSQNGATS